jgi:Matrixin/Protein of unknown function (DUF1573)
MFNFSFSRKSKKNKSQKSKTTRYGRRLLGVLTPEQLEERAVFSVGNLCGSNLSSSDQLDPLPAFHVDPVFAPGTSPQVVASYDGVDANSNGGFDAFTFNDGDRWSSTTSSGGGLGQGAATIITWSVVPDGTPVSGFNGEPNAPSNLRSFLGGIYGTNSSSSLAQDQPWFSVVQQVFDRWSAVAGITYVYEPADDGAALGSSANGALGIRGDVRLSGHNIDGPSNILAYNFYPFVGDMVLDTGDTFFDNTSSNSLRLRNTMAHESGHGLGLGHVTPNDGTKLMESFLSLGFDGPQQDDILAVNRGYGDRLEKSGGNDTVAKATSLGSLSGAFSVDAVSIDDDSDTDYFSFTVGGSSQLNLTLIPTGSTYNSNGSTFNAAAQSDLALAVYGNNGSTLIVSADLTPAGQNETLPNVVLSSAGTYYVKVTGSANAAQMYRLSGSVAVSGPPAPEITIKQGTTSLADGQTFDFGSTAQGTAVIQTFTVTNDGTASLTLTSLASATFPTGFSLATDYGSLSLAPSQSTTFSLRMNATAAGTFSGSLQLPNNDSDENPFDLTLTGTVTASNSPVIVDNGQAGYAETGSGWLGWPTGYNGTVRYNSAGPNGATTSWQQTGLTAGNYQVQATWNAASNHTGSAVYQIYDGTTLRQTVTVDQRPNPSGSSFGGVPFQTLGTVLINSGTLRVVLSNSASGDVVADAVRFVSTSPPPSPTVDLNWSSGGLSGVPATATVQTPFTINRTYTNANTTPSGTTPSASSLAYYSSVDAVFGNADDVLLGSEILPAGQGASVYSGTSPALQFAAAGTYYVFAKLDDGSVLSETDETNNVTQAAQQVVVSAPSAPIFLDNGQAGYAETGAGWQGWPTGYNGSVRYNSAGPNGATASWQQTGLTAGNYQVQATWNAASNHTGSAVYQIYDGTTLRQTVTVDQRPNPSGASFGGVLFQTLGTVLVNSGALRVVLSNSASGDVVADAVRIVSTSPPPMPTVDLNWSSGGLSGVPATTTVQTPFTINRSYSIANTVQGGTTTSATTLAYYSSVDAVFGNADDVLLGSEILPAGQGASVYSGTSPALQFAAAGTYYVFAKLDDGSALSETDETNNVTPAAQPVVVSAPSAPIILDNGGSGYTETGAGWQGWPTGYNGGVRYNSAGPNGATASWQQTGLTAGNYQVQATWNGSFNHTSSAVYQIYDGTTLRQTITVDQRPDPSGASFGGVLFQTLGTVLVNSGALRVVLSNSASGDVVADAIRIVPL